VRYPGKCIDYDFDLDLVWTQPCHDGQNQQFDFTGNFDDTIENSWTLIQQGDLPWISEFDRNPLGVAVSSTYENGDENFYHMEVKFFANTMPYQEYEIRFPELRNPDSLQLQFSEIELPGMLLNEGEYVPTEAGSI